MIKYNVNTCDQICNEFMIHFTKLCPNKCPFCVDAMNKGLSSKSNKPDVESIYNTILKYKDNVASVCISGGEPMLFMDEALSLIKKLKETTNLKVYVISSIPKNCNKNRELFYEILRECDGLTISPQHYKEEVADQIRGHKSTFDRQAFYTEMPYKEKISLNINMVFPYLCEKHDILKCIEHYNKMGFKNIKLAELFNAENMYVRFEDVFGIKLKSPFAHGCSTEFDVTPWIPSYDGKLTVKRTCFLVNKALHANLSDMFKAATRKLFEKKYYFGVIYEDGSLHPYWF